MFSTSFLLTSAIVLSYIATLAHSFFPSQHFLILQRKTNAKKCVVNYLSSSSNIDNNNDIQDRNGNTILFSPNHNSDVTPSRAHSFNRRALFAKSSSSSTAFLSTIATISLVGSPLPAHAKCTDIESCREVGERKVEEDLKLNPIVRLDGGLRYRVLRPPTVSSASAAVTDGSSIDLIYSISSGSGQYMYSKGFGFEKVEFGGKQESDLGLDSLRGYSCGDRIGIDGHEEGRTKEGGVASGSGFRNIRVEARTNDEERNCVSSTHTLISFFCSNIVLTQLFLLLSSQMQQYRKKLSGFESQPPFPAKTVWDIEVLGIR